MGKAIGIDLGTTNTVAAESRAGRTAPTVVMTRDASNTTRSVIAFDDGQWLVGEMAVQVGEVNPAAVISSSKRFIGLRFGDARIREDIARLNSTGTRPRVVAPPEGEGGVRFHLYPTSSSDVVTLSPVDVATRILRQVKQDAESALGGQVTHATITVPAYFDTARIEATRQAGEAAGFVVQRIISEPQAAAIAYGRTLDAEVIETALIYDLGGGTFDVTIATIGQDLCDELAKDGNNHLGGDDFDARLVEIVARKIREVASLDLSASAAALGVAPEKFQTTLFEIRNQCQKAKESLSRVPEVTVSCSLHEWSEMERRGAPRIIGVKVSRVEFEAAISDLIDETIVLTDQALKRANRAEETIDLVLLIGGSTFIPLVRERLRTKFGADKVRVNVNPMEAVAAGAAILAQVLPRLTQCPQCHADQSADNTTCERCGATLIAQPECNDGEGESTSGESKLAVISTLPHALGIETEEGAFEVVLKRGSQYSATDGASLSPGRKSFRVSKDGAPSIRIPVYEGDHPRAKDPTNTYCGEVLLTDLPLDLRQGEEVIVEMTLNGDGAKVITTTLRGRPQRHVLDADGWRAPLLEIVDRGRDVLQHTTDPSAQAQLSDVLRRVLAVVNDSSANAEDGQRIKQALEEAIKEAHESVIAGDLLPALEALSFALARAQAHCQYAARWVDRLPLVNDSFICERLEAEGQLLNIIRSAVVDGRRAFASRNDAGAALVQARLNSLLESADFLWPLTLAEIVSELRPDEEDGVRLSTRGLITDDELERIRAKASSAVQSSTSSSVLRRQYSQEIGVLLTQMRRTIVSDGALFMRQMSQVDHLLQLFFSTLQ